MGIPVALDRLKFSTLLQQIKYFEIEETSITPMEMLHLKSIKKDVNSILSSFDSCTEYLNK